MAAGNCLIVPRDDNTLHELLHLLNKYEQRTMTIVHTEYLVGVDHNLEVVVTIVELGDIKQ